MVAAAILKRPKSRYLDNGLTDRHEIWHGDAIRHLWCVPQLDICNFKNPTWRRPPFWEIEKSPYFGRSFSDFNEICQALVTFWSVTDLKFKEIQDGGARHPKKFKNYDISATVWPIGTSFGMMTQIGPEPD